MSIERRFIWTTGPGDDRSAIPVPFDPKSVFGRANAPVVVAIGQHRYRSTITHIGGSPWVPFRKSHRAAAALADHGDVEVTLTLDEAERTVTVPDDLAEALAALPGGRAAWDALSFTARREQTEAIEGARKPETRVARIDKAVQLVRARLAR